MDQNIWTIITIIVSLLAAFVGGATGAFLSNRYTRSQEKRRKERDVVEEIYVQAITMRRSIDPAIVAASSPNTAIPSTWNDQMISMVAFSELYLPMLNPALEELNKRIESVENAFKHVSYKMDGYGHATKKIMPDDFDQITESY